jgi:DUF3011 family protein
MVTNRMHTLGFAATLLSLATAGAVHAQSIPTLSNGTLVASADDRYDRDHDRGGSSIECKSEDFKYRRCAVPWRHAVLVDQLSDTDCVEGRTWGMDRDGIWVDQGCAGRFAPTRDGHGDHDRDRGHAPGDAQQITCESQGGDRNRCRLPFAARNVRMDQQISDSACVRGRSWDWEGDTIWVSEGCRARFSAWPR